ncbi:MAG: hypothetical protein ABJB47_14490 [Actinomycetota bacterium]
MAPAEPPTGLPPGPPRPLRWSAGRARRSLLVAGLALVAITVLAGLAGHPSPAQRATDLRGFLRDMKHDIESCAGGVRESLAALQAITAGTSRDEPTAISIARYGAANCSPANNELLGHLAQYQVTESLASFRLQRVVTGLLDWAAPDAQQVQTDVAQELAARSPPAKARAAAALRRALARLDAQRTAVDSVIASASTALAARAAPPPLPG